MYLVQWIAFKTIVRREIRRVLRIWIQTLLPACVTSLLYFVIFGQIIGRKIGTVSGYSYLQFIAPGLIMLNILNNAYASTVSSFYTARFQRNIETLLVAPVRNITILLGYVTAGMLRGLLVGLMVSVMALFFTHLPIHSVGNILAVALLSSAIFALGGILNAMCARNFDDIALVPNFILTPLTYLGGVFYSLQALPHPWQYISLANPIFYMVDNFRRGFLGIGEGHWLLSYGLMGVILGGLFYVTLLCLQIGVGLRE